MARQDDHRSYLTFLAKVTTLLSEYSVEDLAHFKMFAEASFPPMAELIEACLKFASKAPRKMIGALESVSGEPGRKKKHVGLDGPPLLDLLCSRDLFPENKDLTNFARKVLPGFHAPTGKGRAVIASRVLRHLEQINGGKREQLEHAMRGAMQAMTTGGEKPEPQSFFGQWEKIIKGMGR